MAKPAPPISPQHQADIERVIDYWFTPITPDAPVTEKWFRPPNPQQVDDEIRANFEPLVEQARTDSLDSWTSTPRGTLALIILLDQYPRNIYRGSHLSHVADAKAVDVAVRAISREFDQSPDLTDLQTLFLYMPLMHAESLVHQVAGIALFETLAARCADPSTANSDSASSPAQREAVVKFVKNSLGFAKAHRDVILWFGRFPSRNKILGRTSTAEEVAFLKENPAGFPMGGSDRKD